MRSGGAGDVPAPPLRIAGGSVEAEQRLDADRETGGERGYAADGEQDTGHERGAVQGVVAYRQGLAVAAEQDLLVRHQAGNAHRVDMDVVNGRASGAVQLLLRGVRRRAEPGLAASLADHGRRTEGRA